MSDSQIAETKQFYNDNVEAYVANISKAGVSHVPQQHLESFTSRLRQSSEPSKVLELGCGDGRDALQFSQMGLNVIGTDFSRSMLLKAQQNAPGIHFLEMDMRRIEEFFLPNSLDGIWACATIIHLPKSDIPALFRSLFRVLRPGGILYVSIKEGFGETFDPDVRYGNVRKFYAFYQRNELLVYLKDAGFELEDVGVADHRKQDSYATNPFIHVFARKPE